MLSKCAYNPVFFYMGESTEITVLTTDLWDDPPSGNAASIPIRTWRLQTGRSQHLLWACNQSIQLYKKTHILYIYIIYPLVI